MIRKGLLKGHANALSLVLRLIDLSVVFVCGVLSFYYSAAYETYVAIGVHGLFVENALQKMKKAGVTKVVTTNCIEHKTNQIDVTDLLYQELKKIK